MKSLIKINEKNIMKYRIMSFSTLLGCCSSRLILKASKMTIIIKLSVYLSQTEANFQPYNYKNTWTQKTCIVLWIDLKSYNHLLLIYGVRRKFMDRLFFFNFQFFCLFSELFQKIRKISRITITWIFIE